MALDKLKRQLLIEKLITDVRSRVGEDMETEYRFDPDGRRWRFDLAAPDLRVACEIDGGVWTMGRHNRPIGFMNDAEKFNKATLLDWWVFHTDWKGVSSGAALDLLSRAILARRALRIDQGAALGKMDERRTCVDPGATSRVPGPSRAGTEDPDNEYRGRRHGWKI
jgi:hypothetical protein